MYLIKHSGSKLYFSSAGSYDRPKWVPLAEATRYVASDFASKAHTHLIRNMFLNTSIVSEATEQAAQMVAAKQAEPKTPNYDLTSDTEESREEEQVNVMVNDDLGIEEPEEPEEAMPVDDPMNANDYPDQPNEEEQLVDTTIDDGASEVDLTISESDQPKAKEIELKDTTKPLEDLVPGENEGVQVPDAIIRALDHTAKEADIIADTTGAMEKQQFAIALAGNARILAELLRKKTVDSIRDAQIKLTSLDNRLFYRLPRLATDFIMSGGKKQTVSDLFTTLRKDNK